jgi:hypothetical protein
MNQQQRSRSTRPCAQSMEDWFLGLSRSLSVPAAGRGPRGRSSSATIATESTSTCSGPARPGTSPSLAVGLLGRAHQPRLVGGNGSTSRLWRGQLGTTSLEVRRGPGLMAPRKVRVIDHNRPPRAAVSPLRIASPQPGLADRIGSVRLLPMSAGPMSFYPSSSHR